MDRTIEQLTGVHKFLDQSNNDVEDSREGREARAWARVWELQECLVWWFDAKRNLPIWVWRQASNVRSSVKRQVQCCSTKIHSGVALRGQILKKAARLHGAWEGDGVLVYAGPTDGVQRLHDPGLTPRAPSPSCSSQGPVLGA